MLDEHDERLHHAGADAGVGEHLPAGDRGPGAGEVLQLRLVRVQLRADAGEDRPVEQADGGPGPETQVLSGLMDERISRALLRLKPNHRQCLILSDVEDMSAVQIGEVMGMSNGAVRVLLCRARGEMRRLLAAEGLVR